MADLSAADLSGANLRAAECIGTRFTGANLSGADFDRTSVSKAVMKDADLTASDFSNAINLTCAQLESAKITATTRLPKYIRLTWTSEDCYECRDRTRRIDDPGKARS